ncbi:MAG: DNA mismatch repair endonuclease MutL [Spirochaetes bacterium]|nr:DNA mismatch repair endonuclease MutL [Spirochaetota bacterium]
MADDNNSESNPKRIHILAPETAKRIAAGEVIERPQSVLRELLDNSIDAGAKLIRVDLRSGGLESLQVRDDGSGMGRDDLELCIQPHATSKISQLDDLLALHSLGFRGEALASVAAVADISIRSALRDDEAWELEAGPGRPTEIRPSRGSRGSSVTVRNLFASFPARKQFLQRPAAESLACRQVFIDKSIAFPELEFHLAGDGKTTFALRPDTLCERVRQAALPQQPPQFFRELTGGGNGFSLRLVAGVPALHRGDRKHIQVFINRRRVQEYRLQQALEYAYREVLPGGSYPVVYAFIELDPTLADFNIHPAKKEVRLRNADDLRQALQRSIRDWLANSWRMGYNATPAQDFELFDRSSDQSAAVPPTATAEHRQEFSNSTKAHSSTDKFSSPVAPYPAGISAPGAGPQNTQAWVQAIQNARVQGGGQLRPQTLLQQQPAGLAGQGADQADDSLGPTHNSPPLRFLGQTLGTFLLFEYADELFILDQHAAHERILYEELCAKKVVSQDLLVPFVYEAASDEEDRLLAGMHTELEDAGFALQREGSTWILEKVPAILPAEDSGIVFAALRDGGGPEAVLKAVRAGIACKAAIKDGSLLDEHAATRLAWQALQLPEARCPHGRPIWVRLSRRELFEAVGRIV